MPRTIRAAPGKPAGRFGNGDHLWVAARGRVLPAGLHVSRRRADGWDVDDNNAPGYSVKRSAGAEFPQHARSKAGRWGGPTRLTRASPVK